jgi:cytochrome c553
MRFTITALSALLLLASAAPAHADVANGFKLWTGQPSARFPAGSHACSACHDLSTGDPSREAADDPQLIDQAINVLHPSSGAMKPYYGPGGTSPLSAADEQDLSDYIHSVVHPGSGQPTFAVAPGAAAFANQATGTTSAPLTLTVSASGAAGTISSISSSNNAEFLIAGGTCLPTPASVAAGASCTIMVTFAPSALGARSSTITILDDGAPNPLTVDATGTGISSGGGGGGNTVTIVEFYDASLHHYFITPIAGELAVLGKPPFQDWQATGLSFNGYAAGRGAPGSVGVCRFFNDHFLGISTHFYAPHGLGCEATIANFPDWTLESADLFDAMLPNADGTCPAGTIPVYRMFNNGMGGAPNHRFTTDLTVRQQMIDAGYTPEGAGIGVGWCAPT